MADESETRKHGSNDEVSPDKYSLRPDSRNSLRYLCGSYKDGPLSLHVFALAVEMANDEQTVLQDIDLIGVEADGDLDFYLEQLACLTLLCGQPGPLETVRFTGLPYDYVVWMEPRA